MPVLEVEESLREPVPTREQRGMAVWAHIVVKSPKDMVGFGWRWVGVREGSV